MHQASHIVYRNILTIMLINHKITKKKKKKTDLLIIIWEIDTNVQWPLLEGLN